MRRRGPVVFALACCIAAAACSKSSSESISAASGAAAAAVANSGVASAGSAGAAASAPSMARPSFASSWRGSYKSVAGTLTLPKDVSWRVPDSAAGIGDGTLALTVEGDGRVHGTIEGPLGPATLNGRVADKRLAARFARSDPADLGYTGLLLGEVSDPDGTKAPVKVTGTMNATVGDATAVRTAAFELTRGAGDGAN